MDKVKEIEKELLRSQPPHYHRKYTEIELEERLQQRKTMICPISVWVASPKLEPQKEPQNNKNEINSINKDKEKKKRNRRK